MPHYLGGACRGAAGGVWLQRWSSIDSRRSSSKLGSSNVGGSGGDQTCDSSRWRTSTHPWRQSCTPRLTPCCRPPSSSWPGCESTRSEAAPHRRNAPLGLMGVGPQRPSPAWADADGLFEQDMQSVSRLLLCCRRGGEGRGGRRGLAGQVGQVGWAAAEEGGHMPPVGGGAMHEGNRKQRRLASWNESNKSRFGLQQNHKPGVNRVNLQS